MARKPTELENQIHFMSAYLELCKKHDLCVLPEPGQHTSICSLNEDLEQDIRAKLDTLIDLSIKNGN